MKILNTVYDKVRKRTKIRNRYNQATYLTQDTNGKVTTSHLDITNITNFNKPYVKTSKKFITKTQYAELCVKALFGIGLNTLYRLFQYISIIKLD